MVIFVAIGILTLMLVGWLIHVAVRYHWDFRAWYHDSDDDF